eukprot:11176459-Lingulodinium_polyedra.AAC.1
MFSFAHTSSPRARPGRADSLRFERRSFPSSAIGPSAAPDSDLHATGLLERSAKVARHWRKQPAIK